MMNRLPAPEMRPAKFAVVLAVATITVAGIGFLAGMTPLLHVAAKAASATVAASASAAKAGGAGNVSADTAARRG